MIKRWSLFAAIIAVTVALGTLVVMALAQQPPPIPKGHISVSGANSAGTCFECHQSSQMPTSERVSFCATCHINTHFALKASFSITRLGPRPKHAVAFDWPASDCATCHAPHKTKVAKHPVTSAQSNSALCQPCHQTPQAEKGGITGQEKVGEFCAACHNLGLEPTHVKTAQDAKAVFCFGCHKAGL